VLKPSAPVPSRPKTLAEIAKEIEAQAQVHRTYSYKPGVKKQRHLSDSLGVTAMTSEAVNHGSNPSPVIAHL